MCCKCCCVCCGGEDTGRSCVDPIIPTTDKAKNWNIGMIVLLGLVAAVTIVKAYFLGLFSILIDVIAFLILWVAICRYDYCLLMLFIILNLVEVFTIVVILGYYL